MNSGGTVAATKGTLMGKQALDGKRLTAFGMNAEDVTVVTDPAHPLCDPEGNDLPIDEAMVSSIIRNGVLKPAIIWKDGDRALLVDGRQRRKNVIAANSRTTGVTEENKILLPVMVFKGSLAEAAELMEELNELRRENSPMVRARRVIRMMKRGRSAADVGLMLGKSAQTIENWAKLLDCSETVQGEVESGCMTLSAAIKLTSLPRVEQDATLAAQKATKAAIVAEQDEVTAEFVDDATGGEPVTKKRAPRTSGPKRTASGAITKGTLRKVYERSINPESEEADNALTDGERKILGWALGRITTDELSKEVPGIRVLLGLGPVEAASADDAPPVDVEEIDEEDRDEAEAPIVLESVDVSALEDAA